MRNIFIDVNQDTQRVLEEAARFVCQEADKGQVCGMSVQKEADGSVYVPIVMRARVSPMEQGQDMRWRNKINITAFACADQPFLNKVYGSRVPSKYTGKDRVSLWYKMDDEGSLQEQGDYDYEIEESYDEYE